MAALRFAACVAVVGCYLEQRANLPGESTIRLAVMVTVMLSIVAHGLSPVPGIDLYARRIASLDPGAPEHQAIPVEPDRELVRTSATDEG